MTGHLNLDPEAEIFLNRTVDAFLLLSGCPSGKNEMSDGETGPKQSLESGLAREQEAGETGSFSLSPRFSDVAAVLRALAETGGPTAASKSSITDQGLRDLCRYLVEHDPSSQLFVPLAEEFCSRKLWPEAVATCRRGLALHPRQFRIRVLLGWALWEQGQTKEAESLLAEARKELEKSAVIYKILARAAESRGDSVQAWRLMHIYQCLQPSEPRPAVEATDRAAEQPSKSAASRGLPLLRVLAGLLNDYEAIASRTVPPMQIFSEADRLLLANILRARKP